MKAKLLLFFFSALAIGATAQVEVTLNPQVGIIAVSISQEPSTSGIRTNNKVGWIAGLDARIGGRGYFQPGIMLTSTKTVYRLDDSLSFNEEEVARTSFRLKAMGGYKVIENENFNLRVAAGPTYDILVNVKNDGNTIVEDNAFRSGLFNLDAAVGIDYYILSAEFGYTYGLTNAYQNNSKFNPSAKYQGIYATIGLSFGLTKAY